MENYPVFYVIFAILFININLIIGGHEIERMPAGPPLPPRNGFINPSNMRFNPSNTFAQFPMRQPAFAPMSFTSNPLLNGGGYMRGFNPLARMYQNPYQQQNPNYFNSFGGMEPQQQGDEIYSAIGYDKMDPNSQMRLTITERRRQRTGMNMNPMYPGMDFDNDFDDYDGPTDWYVQGAFLGSQIRNKAGTYHLVLTTSGRTADGCVSESLGRIASPDMVDINNPFLQHTMSSGVLPNPVMLGSSGPTVYASTLEGVSRRQLVGAGLAVCQYINNGVCGGYIPFCATIGKDVLPAMEVPMESQQSSAPTTFTFDPIGLQQGGFMDQRQLGNGPGSLMAFPGENNRPTTLAKQEQQQTSVNDVLGLLF